MTQRPLRTLVSNTGRAATGGVNCDLLQFRGIPAPNRQREDGADLLPPERRDARRVSATTKPSAKQFCGIQRSIQFCAESTGKDAEAFPRNAVARLDGAGRGRVLLLLPLLGNTCRVVRVLNRGGFVVGECDCVVGETSGRRYCALDRQATGDAGLTNTRGIKLGLRIFSIMMNGE